jgi:hypothetical protein
MYNMKITEELDITQEWDKVFPKSDKVNHEKVCYVNRYGITLVADLYTPKDTEGKLPALAVGSPYGAVKEQAAGIYAMKMAEMGYVTLAFDPSFNGESGGNVRLASSPDINTEDFSASVDYLVCLDNVDSERIGIIGICGFGGLAISAAAMDPRIKATVSSTMGSFDDHTHESRIEERKRLANQRTIDVQNGTYANAPSLPKPCPDDAPDFIKDYCDFYHTERGYHPRSINSGLGWNATTMLSHITFSLFDYADEIENAVMLVHGSEAFSYYASEKVFRLLKGDNKEFLTVEGASHCDLYDGGDNDYIPFDKIDEFFKKYL